MSDKTFYWLDEIWDPSAKLPDGQGMPVRMNSTLRNRGCKCWREVVDADFQTLIRTTGIGRTTLEKLYTMLSDNGVEPAWAAEGGIKRLRERGGLEHGAERHEWWCICCQRWVDSWPAHKDPHRPSGAS